MAQRGGHWVVVLPWGPKGFFVFLGIGIVSRKCHHGMATFIMACIFGNPTEGVKDRRQIIWTERSSVNGCSP